MTNAANLETSWRTAAQLAMSAAVAMPMLLAFNLSPSPTTLNQCLSVGLWGAAIAFSHETPWRLPATFGATDLGAFAAALIALLVGLGWSVIWGYLPISIGAAGLGTIAAAGAVAITGRGIAAGGSRNSALVAAFFWALVIGGGLSAVIASVQVLAPTWPDGAIVARSSIVGRAVGNLRQPNHLSSLLLWALVAAVALTESARMSRAVAGPVCMLMVYALVLSGSRTGALGTCVLAVWGLLDRQLSRSTRLALVALPALYGLAWLAMMSWGQSGDHVFGAQDRLSPAASGDFSSSRFAIWRNALALIADEPWMGVGFGEFNLAWTLSAFPDRPVAFFDHTHNLPLQLAVELGLPLGLLVNILLLVALAQAGMRAWRSTGDIGAIKRAAFMLVLMIGLHSLLEYPLWYAYFLLPTAFAWSVALSRSTDGGYPTSPGATERRYCRTMALVGVALVLGATAALLDYYRIVVIYEPPVDAAPLDQRIESGQRSLLFGHHADYAAATAFGEPEAPLSPAQQLAFRRAPHHLLDVRLMIAWAQAMAAEGKTDQARWLAARIREFRNPGADDFFAPCGEPAEAAQAFQCQPPQRAWHWRDFVSR